MANFIEKTLEPGEKIIFKGRLHWYFNFRYTVWGIVLIILGLALLVLACNNNIEDAGTKTTLVVGLAFGITGILFIFYGYFLRIKTEFAITNTRFIQKDGILNIRLTEIPLFKVETVNFSQTLIERIVHTGSIELVGSGGTNHKIEFIQNPFDVRNLITTYMKESKTETINA